MRLFLHKLYLKISQGSGLYRQSYYLLAGGFFRQSVKELVLGTAADNVEF